MDMVDHQNVRVDAAADAVLVDGKDLEVFLEVCGVPEDPLLLVAAGEGVAECAGKLDAGLRSMHDTVKRAGVCQ